MPLSPDKLRKEINLTSRFTYFDNSSTTLTPNFVIESINDYYKKYCVNVERSSYALAQKATKEYESGRENVARYLLNCHPEELIFTRNFTEGANLAAYALGFPVLDRGKNKFSFLNGLINWKRKDNIVCTLLEHHSNFMPWMRLAKQLGVQFKVVHPDSEGLLSVDAFKKSVDKNTRLVAFQHVSNAFGSIHPIADIISQIRKINPDVLIFIDGSQALGHIPVDFNSLGCDFYAFSGHKGPMGPKGTGGLVVKKKLLNFFHPFFIGGGTVTDVTLVDYKLKDDFQRFDGGTPNIPGLIGLGVAAKYLGSKIGIEQVRKHEFKLAQKLLSGLAGVKGIEIYGPKDSRFRAGIVAFNLKGWLCHDLALVLDEKYKILTRAGHHCCIPAMRFFNLLDKYGGNVRVSLHYYNTQNEIDLLLDVLNNAAPFN